MLEQMSDDELDYWMNFARDFLVTEIVNVEDLLETASLVKLLEDETNVQSGFVIVEDPVAQYYESIPVDQRPAIVAKAPESGNLRVLWPKVNNLGFEECLVDSGSQIISMAKSTAERLTLTWDPDICIHMQSANKQLDRTLGLAKNVPFKFGSITVYLQVHIIANAAYNILLGRPFDMIAESKYENQPTGEMNITIKCPQTGRRETLVTLPRGAVPSQLESVGWPYGAKKSQNPPDIESHSHSSAGMQSHRPKDIREGFQATSTN